MLQKLDAGRRSYCQWAKSPLASILVSLLASAALPYIYGCLCEFVRTASLHYLVQYLVNHYIQIAFGAVVMGLLFAFFTLLTGRPWVGNAIVGSVLWVMSWANLYKVMWRGEPIQPKDLYQISAAAGIAREFDLRFTRENYLFFLFLVFTTLLLLPFRLPFGRGGRSMAARLGSAAATFALLPLYFSTVLYNNKLMSSYDIGKLDILSMSDSYYSGSFVTSFCVLTRTLFPIEAPEGYNAKSALEAAALLPAGIDAASQRRCDVIVVLLESYFFLDNYDTAKFSEPLTTNFDRLAKEGITGRMLSSGYGGGTANIEFNVLSGFTQYYLPTGSTPYMEYIHPGFVCYPQFLKAQGYTTLAVHPYFATFYNRHYAYPAMGIDRFFSQENFEGTPNTGDFIGDADTCAKALVLYREAAPDADAAPVFLHIVTMQNHGPNRPGKYPADHLVNAFVPEADDAYNGCLTSLATGLRDIDAAIGAFTDALRAQDRDVVVLFFGDHQAPISGDTGDDLLNCMASYKALPAAEQTLRSHVTPYLMWANFPTGHEGEDAGLLPSHMLLPVMLDAFNVVRPVWFDWLLAADNTLGDLDYDLYFTDEATLLGRMTVPQQTVYRAEELLQYDLMFGEQYARDALYGLPD